MLKINSTLAFVVALSALPAHGGEIVDCTERPGSGRWVYRIIDARRCWFPAGSLSRGEEKPREELRWKPPEIPPVSIMVPELEPLQPPEQSEFERRWQGAPEGWNHKE